MHSCIMTPPATQASLKQKESNLSHSTLHVRLREREGVVEHYSGIT